MSLEARSNSEAANGPGNPAPATLTSNPATHSLSSDGGGANGKNGKPAHSERADGKPSKSKDSTQFWRAARHLWPYRRIIGVSILCAFFVGLAVSSGLTAML